jgi:hypothetical protein
MLELEASVAVYSSVRLYALWLPQIYQSHVTSTDPNWIASADHLVLAVAYRQ